MVQLWLVLKASNVCYRDHKRISLSHQLFSINYLSLARATHSTLKAKGSLSPQERILDLKITYEDGSYYQRA
jgi:hypothetical protein